MPGMLELPVGRSACSCCSTMTAGTSPIPTAIVVTITEPDVLRDSLTDGQPFFKKQSNPV